jgi:Sulfotransferase family
LTGERGSGLKQRRIAHIINPVRVAQSSDLYLAQPVTFMSMAIAREMSKATVDVRQYAAHYAEDLEWVPDGFYRTTPLDRSALDLSDFVSKRKLPILSDILDRLFEASDADYFVYTNVDIALMPGFYLAVNRMIEEGLDTFVINRRTISNRYTSVADLPLMFAEIGEPHKGYDCFVFRRDAYPGFTLGNVCTGMPWNGRVLLWNLSLSSERFKEFKDLHLTFHIGNDRIWKREEYADYASHNRREAIKVLAQLERREGAIDRLDGLGYLRPFQKGSAGRPKGSGAKPVASHKKYLFVGGLHRSGTSIFANALKAHPEISGFVNTGVPRDEGQFLQALYPTERVYGGPGVFGFSPEMHLTETSPLASEKGRETLFTDWSKHWDTSRPVLLEKSPPNLLKTRFLQALFPNAYFLIITRHPVPTSYATQKGSKTSVDSLLRHWVHCHTIFCQDAPHLARCFVLKYENFVTDPQAHLDRICDFIGIARFEPRIDVKTDVNRAYFERWRSDRASEAFGQKLKIFLRYRMIDRQIRPLGYSLSAFETTEYASNGPPP